MKQIITRLFLFLVVTITLGGCNKSGDPSANNNSGGSTGGTTGGGNGGTTAGTVTTPNTEFISQQDYTVSSPGSYMTQQFTLKAATKLVFRFAAQYQAQAAVIDPNQYDRFSTNQTFIGYGLFDKQVGTTTLTLNAGTYYLAVRNASTGANKWSVELDFAIDLPLSDRATFYDDYLNGVQSLNAGAKFWQPFSIQKGFRYFLDGCNVNCDVHIIAASQLAAFQGNQTFQYFTDYYQAGGSAPGLSELKLPAGDYYMVSNNAIPGTLVYTLERWKLF